MRNRCVPIAVVMLFIALILIPLSSAEDYVALYTAKCGNCHGPDGAGKTAAGTKNEVPDLRSKKIHAMSDKQLYETIAMGKEHKSYPHAYLYTGLTEQQIRGIVAHVRTFK